MPVTSFPDTQLQIDRLNRRLRRLQLAITGIFAIGLGLFLSAHTLAQGLTTLRARSLVIEDENGKARVILGAPVPGPQRISASTGLIILDENGNERFGLGLLANGNMGMGFDAPPGTGDPRNRERINFVADATGGAYVAFKNRKTQVPGRLVVDEKDQFYLEFLDFQSGKVMSKRIGFKGEEASELQP